MTGPDPLTLPRIAPSRLRHAIARRCPDSNGVPDPRNAYRKTLDEKLLREIVRRAFADHAEHAPPPGWRGRVTELLLADLDRRYPPAKMAVLAEYGCARPMSVLAVDIHPAAPPVCLSIPERQLPAQGFPHQLTARTDAASRIFVDRTPAIVAAVPAIVQPIFDSIAAAWAARQSNFLAAIAFPLAFEKQNGRPPKWSEIEAAYPHIGAWMCLQRGDA